MSFKALVMGNRQLACSVYDQLSAAGVETLAIVNPSDTDDSTGVSFASYLTKKNHPFFRFKSLKHDEAINFLKKEKPKLAISCSYERIVPPAFIEHFNGSIYNFHAADLPRNRGCLPVVWSIFDVPEKLCMTFHELDAGLDTGAIVKKAYIDNRPGMTAEEAYKLLVNEGTELFREILPRILNGESLPRQRQDESISTYHSQVFPWDRWLDFSSSAIQNSALINACSFFPHPSARARLADSEIQIMGPSLVKIGPNRLPVGAVEYRDEKYWIQFLDGQASFAAFRQGMKLIYPTTNYEEFKLLLLHGDLR